MTQNEPSKMFLVEAKEAGYQGRQYGRQTKYVNSSLEIIGSSPEYYQIQGWQDYSGGKIEKNQIFFCLRIFSKIEEKEE